MAKDPEQQLYEDIANLTEEVPKLQNKIKALKKGVTELSNRVENLELMTFQDQISKLDDKINSVNNHLVSTGLSLAEFEMDFIQYHMRSIIGKRLQSPKRERAREKITSMFAAASEAARHSSEPLDIAYKFRKECAEYSKANKLDAFLD